MQTEETKKINEETPFENSHTNPADASNEAGSKAFSKSNAAFAAGGFVAGAGVSAGVQAFASGTSSEEPAEDNEETGEQDAPLEDAASGNPNPQDVLIATDEGMRIAQVSNDQSFAEAFADARAQVGPGGAFEWRGSVYNTYYKEEWNQMTPTQRHEYQAKVDYNEIAPSSDYHNPAPPASNSAAMETSMPEHEQQIGEIKVLGIEEVIGQDGRPMTAVGMEMEGDQVLLLDIDQDDVIDALIVDVNQDGVISPNEIFDISGADIRVSDLQQNMMESAGLQYVHNDNLPDYTNDADLNALI